MESEHQKREFAVVTATENKLYFGSQRLYTLNCYVRQSLSVLDEYLGRLWTLPRVSAVETLSYECGAFWTGLAESVLKFPEHPRQFTETVFNHPALFLYLADQLLRNNVNACISGMVEQFVRQRWGRSNLQMNAYSHRVMLQEFGQFCMRVEACQSKEQALTTGLFKDAASYSPMKQDIQFCGSSREEALPYAAHRERFLFTLVLSGDLSRFRFVDMDDPGTIYRLMHSSPLKPGVPMPFHSGATFPREFCLYYGERDLQQIRTLIWDTLYDAMYYKEEEEEEPAIRALLDIQLRLAPDMTHLRDLIPGLQNLRRDSPFQWSLLHRACANEDGEDVYIAILRALSQRNRGFFAWYFWDRARTSDADILATTVSAEEHTSIHEWVRNTMHKQQRLDTRRLHQLQFLDRFFGIKNNTLKTQLAQLVSGVVVHDSDSELAPPFDRQLASTWTTHFCADLASPRGIWVYTHHRQLLLPPKPAPHHHLRESHYIIDSLLVRVLTTSALFRNQKWCGWRCASMGEWLISEPQARGTVEKVVPGYTDMRFCHPFECMREM